jgi:aryl-alcohol dehydrogenase-like predicted oxidoreductase
VGLNKITGDFYMETRKIGSLDVSVVGLGCNNFGRRLDYDGTKAVIDAALDAGINFFDTADIYGGTKSEEFIGKALGARRSQVIIATKFGNHVEGQGGGASAAYVRKAAEASLRRLNTDYIDLYQLHTPDSDTPIEETLAALDELVKEGKVREIGSSNFTLQQIREAEEAVPPGGARFVSLQNEYSMLQRKDEDGVLPECERLVIYPPKN